MDEIGNVTLANIAEADRFNKWMFRTIQAFCSDNMLEIGSGIGNMSDFFINYFNNVSLSDIDSNYLKILQQKYKQVSMVFEMDISHTDFASVYKEYLERYDTVVALNVVEHIKNHKQAIQNIFSLLRPGGRAVILVPAYNGLYNGFDKNLGHFRRYTKKSLSLLVNGQFHVIYTQYFNFIGIFGWFLSGRVFNKKIIPGGQMNLFNLFVPVFKLIDSMTFHRIGLSVICVGEKPMIN